jgi:1-acyl-sn-glycerol-3-phosphate acyltransferase
VIPIAVTSAKCWPRKAFIKTPGVVDVSIGPPIPSAGRQPDELMREVEAWIEAEMRRLDPEAYRTVVPDYAELRNQLKAEVLPGL